jgi:cytochrome c biogenesis protein CcdA/thiol-disulfide isomerase/thioredoxin
MVLLMIFALVAGAATALSPCALPVLPVVFSAGVTGGRRRPIGVATGLAVSFTLAVVALVYVIAALGLPDDLLRTLAIAVLLVFGLSLIVPSAAARVETWISGLTAGAAGQVNQATAGAAKRDGFWSGFVVGAGLGLVYAPCAGPILAGVITATASQDLSAARLAVAAAYGVGSALTFYALMLGGRRLVGPLARRSKHLQTAMGVTMVLVALAMYGDLDVRFQSTIADELPAALVNPTGSLERSSAVKDELAQARGRSGPGKFESERPREPAAKASDLPVLGQAPEFTGNQEWFNTPGGKPLTLAELKGKVVLVDFWTYTCINCLRTLPHLREWWSKYEDKGLVIVGMHTPEFPFERSAANVREALGQNELRYPVAQDNDYATWNAFQNQYWPAKYLIDARGRVRYTHFGEGEYDTTEQAIRSLLAEAGNEQLGSGRSKVADETPAGGHQTPETYLGSARAVGFVNGPIEPGRHRYRPKSDQLAANEFRYRGPWAITPDEGRSAGSGSQLDARFLAREVFLVLSSPGRSRDVRVLLDGKPIRPRDAGDDVSRGRVRVGAERLYRLVKLPRRGEHTLSLNFERGVSGYAFTFG